MWVAGAGEGGKKGRKLGEARGLLCERSGPEQRGWQAAVIHAKEYFGRAVNK